jgi:hypothetical protein
MNFPHPHRLATGRRNAADRDTPARRRLRARIVTGGLVLAAVGTVTAAAGPEALAAPASPAQSAQSSRGSQSAAASAPKPGVISWSIAPATPTQLDAGRAMFSYTNIKAGSTISDHVAILNHSLQPVSFTIYSTDASGTSPQNTLLFLPPWKKPTDIGTWESFQKHVTKLSIIIGGGKGVIEPFTISVPRQATPGDHTGGMAAAVSFNRKTSKGTVVTENQRIIVPIEMRVAGKLTAGLRVESISAGYHGSLIPFGSGSASVAFSVYNSGNIRLAGTEVISVTGPFGVKGSIPVKSLPTVLPGDSVRLTANAKGLLPAGPMTAHVHVTPGPPVGTATLPLTAAAAAGNAPLFAVPWSLLLLLVLIAGLAVAIGRGRRWQRNRLTATLSAVAEQARRETERRLAGDAGTSAAGPQRPA